MPPDWLGQPFLFTCYPCVSRIKYADSYLQYTVSVSILVLLKDIILCIAVQIHCCPLYVLSMVRDNTDTATVPLLMVTPDTDFPGQLHDNVATGLPPLS